MVISPARKRDFIATVAGLAAGIAVGLIYYRSFPHGVSRRTWALAPATLVALLVHWLVMSALVQRARKLQADPLLIDVDVAESTVVMRSADETWAALHDPAFASITSPLVVDAISMPSIGAGLGEVQVFLAREGDEVSISAVEVIQFESGRFARARPLPPHRWATEEWTDYRVDPLDTRSCRVTISEHLKLRIVQTRQGREIVEAERENRLANCRHVLERLTASLVRAV